LTGAELEGKNRGKTNTAGTCLSFRRVLNLPMQTRITPEEIHAAAVQLSKSERGRRAMERLAELAEHDELRLDFLDQRAFLTLLGGVWSGQAAKVRDAVRAAPPV
jgi:hypothetical protein